MCIIAFAHQVHPEYPLILIGNRDEFYNRPTQEIHWWDEKILAGKDLEAGGTWLGFSKEGRFSIVTNYRDIAGIKQNARSRGDLPLNFIRGSDDMQAYVSEISEEENAYNGYNLLLWEKGEMVHYSNYESKINPIQPGVHALSNALLNTPWHKTERLKKGFENTIDGSFNVENLFSLLTDEVKADDKDLPSTGLPYEREKEISSICIRTKDYGTCSSTVVLVDKNREVTLIERIYSVGNRTEQENVFSWSLE